MVQGSSEQIIRRIAFPLIGGRAGTGSYNYLLNLIRAIDSYAPKQLTSVLFVGADVPAGEIAPFRESGSVEVVQAAAFNVERDQARLRHSMFMGVDWEAAGMFVEHRIDVAFETAAFFGWRFPLPVIAWLPDFQHRHLRHLFSRSAYWRRELGFRAQIGSKRLIMLSSEDARDDCERFYRLARGRTAVVRFAVHVDAALLAGDPAGVAREYGLPERFFYLPNQFWKHKNHGLAVEAVHLLKQKGEEVVVAASGKIGDPRNPDYFTDLQTQVASLGLAGNFRFLGLIPRAHVIALMRSCTALINPSLFEGWSTPVEESRTLGVPMLLSALRVHREQMGDAAKYFAPDSVTQLAELISAQPSMSASQRQARETAAIEASSNRVRKYCADFVDAVERAILSGRSRRP